MSDSETPYPLWPPGLWRRIVLQPGQSWIGAALEDDMHRFHLRLDHRDGRITQVKAEGVRYPWTGCSGAPGFMEKELEGELLLNVAQRDPTQHCTHLFDLAIVAAAHAGDTGPTTFDMKVADRVEGRTTATLAENGTQRLCWQLCETMIEGPERFAGLDIKRVSRWKHDFPAVEGEWSTLLRRAIFISGARVYEKPVGKTAADMGPLRMGVCFNYQEPQARESMPIFERLDFSMTPGEPLEDFDAAAVFRAMG